MDQKIKVLLVDDHVLVRRGFRRILEDEADIAVVGEAGDGKEAIRMASKLKPKVVLMDWVMPGMNGLDATRGIVKTCPEASVLLLTMYSGSSWVRQAIEAGARGYILKNAVNVDLALAVRRVASGKLTLAPLPSQPVLESGDECRLTRREREVLRLIVEGKSTKEIAAKLNLSENTVGVHRGNMMRHLGVHKTAELVVYAVRRGWLTFPEG